MKAATRAVQRPADARLLVVGADGDLRHAARAGLARFLHPGDLLVANDAATLPASLHGVHGPSGGALEVRLAGRRSLAFDDVRAFTALVFGQGDHRTRTEERPAPPPLRPGDALFLGPLRATVVDLLGHPRLVELAFSGTPDAVWAGIAQHGRPIQYAHLARPLALWDAWTRVAGRPVAFEPPSAGFLLDWRLLAELRARGVGFATLTHAAGISSTGDPALDARLPLDEAYDLPAVTVAAIARTRRRGGRVVALGTTVTRTLEHAASRRRTAEEALPAGPGLATQRIGADSELAVVDAIVSGTHEPGDSHFELLRAFTADAVLARVGDAFERHGYRTHEFGDSLLLVARRRAAARPALLARRAALAPPRRNGYAEPDVHDERERRSA